MFSANFFSRLTVKICHLFRLKAKCFGLFTASGNPKKTLFIVSRTLFVITYKKGERSMDTDVRL